MASATVAFVLCAMAPSFAALLVARVLQGVGAALVLSCGPALATSLYHESARTRVLGIYTMVIGAGGALGPLVAGLLVPLIDWPAVFWFRAPIALAASEKVSLDADVAMYLKRWKLPPIAQLRAAGVPIAIATDNNPGSSPVTSPLLMLNMACTLFRLTPEEALAGVTRHAATALDLSASHGTLEIGKAADFCAWDIERPAELAYRIGFNPCSVVVQAGLPIRMADLAR